MTASIERSIERASDPLLLLILLLILLYIYKIYIYYSRKYDILSTIYIFRSIQVYSEGSEQSRMNKCDTFESTILRRYETRESSLAS